MNAREEREYYEREYETDQRQKRYDGHGEIITEAEWEILKRQQKDQQRLEGKKQSEARIWSIKDTLDGLRYISRSPSQEQGGCDPTVVIISSSALHHLRIYRRKISVWNKAMRKAI